MISIIISSVNQHQLKNVTENIKSTIGIPFEILATYNSNGQMSISQVYNSAARKARYDILCFMHEDIILKTGNWGRIVTDIFAMNASMGLIGIAGCSYKTFIPSSWVSYGVPKVLHYQLEQSFKRGGLKTEYQIGNPDNAKLSPVACVDGVWLCTPKKIFNEFLFDENLLTGFHGYDIDYSLAVNQKYTVAVSFEILINHLSEGDFNISWLYDTLKVQQKWRDKLPLNIARVSKKEASKLEWKSFKVFVNQLVSFNLSPGKFSKQILTGASTKIALPILIKMHYYLLRKSLLQWFS